ncbi:MAG: class I SAM-dependent methyltransferase [Spirochaetes bacterium]|nr:MAG: class I SAM-dependent methyltransferase [Spirochaetota bacterium]
MKLYHELAEYYFAIEEAHRNIQADLSLIRTITGANPDPTILDLGCGTGEHLGMLASRGFRCTGIDSSEDMLAIAGKRNQSPSISFLRQDMLSFDYYEQFDIVTCLFGSFDYLLDDADVDKVLWNTWRALKPGGAALFEVWNANPVREISSKPMSTVSMIRYKDRNIERRRGFALLTSAPRTIVEVRYVYLVACGDRSDTLRDKHVMRAFDRKEIERFVADNGFALKGMYSNSALDPYKDTSNKIIVHFVKE